MNRLNNKNALITGGTSGIGLETAREFLNEGARVAITAKDQESLEAARQELGESGVLADCLRCRERTWPKESRRDYSQRIWTARYPLRQCWHR
jgi:NAD(P)-dependent dehydrogenase (short-subunit alcohol dehydrogenase family)